MLCGGSAEHSTKDKSIKKHFAQNRAVPKEVGLYYYPHLGNREPKKKKKFPEYIKVRTKKIK
jgi:hypothetical protein